MYLVSLPLICFLPSELIINYRVTFLCTLTLQSKGFYHPRTEYVYIFPPFNLFPRVLKKLKEEGTVRALVIVPEWTTQTWFPKLEKMRVGDPVHLKPSKTLLVLPSDTTAIHPLYPELSLMACILSGKE